MANYRIEIEYDGTSYHGWQVQPDSQTVQQALEKALSTVLRHPVRVAGAGRTDAGVHALGQVAVFVSSEAIEPRVLRRSLNALLRPDVVVRSVDPVAEDFDPRRSAVCRLYEYRIWNHPWPSAFWHRYSWHVAQALDLGAMQLAAAAVIGEHDFSTFRAADCESVTALRRVTSSTISEVNGFTVYRVEANAFLKGMVRSLVGTLVRVGRGEMSADKFAQVLASRDRKWAGPTAPPHGLFLMRVVYSHSQPAKAPS